jgi:hypothetical protein
MARSAAGAVPQKPGSPLAAPPQAGGDRLRDNALTNAANALAKYIPNEVVTLSIAGVAAGPALRSIVGFGSRARLYWGFVIMTPLLYLLVYVSFLKTNSQFISFAKLPGWQALASAFAVWALAVPGNPKDGFAVTDFVFCFWRA